MNTEFKKLGIFLGKVIFILVLADWGLGFIMERLYDRMHGGEKARANYFIKKDTSNLVIFGSSRALYHYQSDIIGDSLHTTVYNAGRSNQSILYHLALLKTILKRHTPETIILDINEDELAAEMKKYDVLSALLPYCRYDADIRDVYLHANPDYRYWSWSHTLPYNSSLFSILYRGFTEGKDKDVHGYLAHDGLYKGSWETINNCQTALTIDPLLQDAFEEFITLCQSHHIKLFIAVSPRYVRYACPRAEFKAAEEIAAKHGLHIHSFAETETRPQYFSDPTHLNGTGSVEFSKIVAKAVKIDHP
jgi:hypothetical protein